MQKFENKNGELSKYSFTCGYIQVFNSGDNLVQLYQETCFHVKVFIDSKRIVWETKESLTESRKIYKKWVKKIKIIDGFGSQRIKFANMYLDWWNNFLTVPRFSEYYNISEKRAERIINIGRKWHNIRAEILK